MSKYMTKKEAIRCFLEQYNGPVCDRTWKRCAWLDYTDYLCKSYQISSEQYDNWTNPFAK